VDRRTAIAELRDRFCGERCKEERPCYDCPFKRVLEPSFADMVDILKDWLTHYPETVFPRHLGGLRDVGPIFIDMLRDAVDFIDQHPSGEAKQPADLAALEHEVEELRAACARIYGALEKAVSIIRQWHGLKLPDSIEERIWNIYFGNAPEMAPIRQALFSIPDSVKQLLEDAKIGRAVVEWHDTKTQHFVTLECSPRYVLQQLDEVIAQARKGRAETYGL